jgi:hypothetical protein
LRIGNLEFLIHQGFSVTSEGSRPGDPFYGPWVKMDAQAAVAKALARPGIGSREHHRASRDVGFAQSGSHTYRR